jgi:hypothetical protein
LQNELGDIHKNAVQAAEYYSTIDTQTHQIKMETATQRRADKNVESFLRMIAPKMREGAKADDPRLREFQVRLYLCVHKYVYAYTCVSYFEMGEGAKA